MTSALSTAAGLRWLAPRAARLRRPAAPALRALRLPAAARAASSVRVIESVAELRAWRRQQLLAGRTVGLVPTMGALHEGHARLVAGSLSMNDATVVSIFVNPSQFAPTEDLDSYPRDLAADVALLEAIEPAPGAAGAAVDVVFAPTVAEMYPSGIPLERERQVGAFVEVEGLSRQLEGAVRPQFFRGVATVVAKLLNAATPDRVYFGQKDVQQTAVIRRLIADLLIDTVMVVVPTVRERGKLALSSRNVYFSPDQRAAATVLYDALAAGRDAYRTSPDRAAVVPAVTAALAAAGVPAADVDYVSFAEPAMMTEIDRADPIVGAVLSAAIRLTNRAGGKTRIIDNLIL
ncbi:Pantoate-beta-alanine ligase [Dipodascopsis tothii]|uniref:Pantoate-beta-alanine ligase n=1 Tax=Dipodascopsis tothii TaxID=44089 RepID=UPI0034CE4E49